MGETTVGFQLHPDLLYSVVLRQAGTLAKAVTEGVMNAVEANAKAIHIRCLVGETEDDRVVITDDGEGFSSAAEINRVFAVFGQPHTEEEQKVKTYAQFRIGRGQMFAFGRNIWRTGPFEMDIDIKNRGSSFIFTKGLPKQPGCQVTIELYSPIRYSHSTMEEFSDVVRQQVEFVRTPIFFNDERISHDPKTCKWDLETEDAYFNFHIGQAVYVYNRGIAVCSKPPHELGLCGIVVSKKQLRVNFARNDIMADCPVWAEIRKVLTKNRARKRRAGVNRSFLSESDRLALLKELRNGSVSYDEAYLKKLIPDIYGRHHAIHDLSMSDLPWTIGKMDPVSDDAANMDLRVDSLQRAGVALVLSEHVCHDLKYLGPKHTFFTWLLSAAVNSGDASCAAAQATRDRLYSTFKPLEELVGTVDDVQRHLIPQGEYEAVERMTLNALSDSVVRVFPPNFPGIDRRLLIGHSTDGTTIAWTDGRSYIVFDREHLRRDAPWNSGLYPKAGLILTYLHELAHEDSTSKTHFHGLEFLTRFELLVREYLSALLQTFVRMTDRASAMKKAERQQKLKAQQERRRAKKLGLLKRPVLAKTAG